ncbi:MAG TPA: metal-dependent hydrolase [Bryobacterales bacterium]|nr:metal-dependent hydrolase [Bryobacterales bacterium]
MTPAAHLLSGYLAGKGAPAGKAGRRRVLAAALIGSIAPDLDVVPGLLGGWAGAGLHRGATHSFVGAAILAWLIAALLGRKERPLRLPLFLAAWLGVLTHIFWDWLNPWGVIALWPWPHSFRGNLVHEADLYIMAILLLAAALAWRGKSKAAVAALAISLPVYLAVQWRWRDRARELAAVELSGRRLGVYPTSDLRCGWVVLSADDSGLSAGCVAGPRAKHLRPLYHAIPGNDFFVQASERSPGVQEFRRKIPFPFAEVRQEAKGGATVFWRDLRIACLEGPTSDPAGLQVKLDAAGRILGERHHWWLRLW